MAKTAKLAWFTIARPEAIAQGDAQFFTQTEHIMLIGDMPPRQPKPFETTFADITHQEMTISGHQQDPDRESHLAITIIAVARDGLFKNQELELQISRRIDFDCANPYAGALFQSKPSLMFGVSTDTERFGHLVTLISTKALKNLYLCFEPPKYGKAKIISWHASTESESDQ